MKIKIDKKELFAQTKEEIMNKEHYLHVEIIVPNMRLSETSDGPKTFIEGSANTAMKLALLDAMHTIEEHFFKEDPDLVLTSLMTKMKAQIDVIDKDEYEIDEEEKNG